MRKSNPLGPKPFDAAESLNDEQTIAESLTAGAEMAEPAMLLDALAAVGRASCMAEKRRLLHDRT